MKKAVLAIVCSLLFFVSGAQVKRVEGVSIVVSDMDRAVKFYSDVLQFRKTSDAEVSGAHWEKLFGVFGLRMRIVRLELGEESIELIDYLTSGGRAIPDDFKSNDLSFQHIAIVVSDIDSAYRVLRKHNVTHVSTGPQTLPKSIPAAAGISAFYFLDPDKHVLELICFPKNKGDEKWQQNKDRLFLGIDHTAIGIENTQTSDYFYNGTLGLDKKGESWNKGTEQEHLNNVEGASLRITGYRAAAGPGVEFLEYLFPRTAKKYPENTRSDDLWNLMTRLEVSNAEELYYRLKGSGKFQLISRELVKSDNQKSFVVRDPDGHAIWMIEKVPSSTD